MDKNGRSRRKLLQGVAKLAYVAPTLTLLSMVTENAHAFSPPCSPHEPGCATPAGTSSPERQSRTQRGGQRPKG